MVCCGFVCVVMNLWRVCHGGVTNVSGVFLGMTGFYLCVLRHGMPCAKDISVRVFVNTCHCMDAG